MFRVGQKVVCVDADGTSQLSEGAVYTVAYIGPPERLLWRGKFRKSCNVRLVEVKPSPGYCGFAPERFRPAVDRPTDISCFKALLRGRELERVV